MEPKHFGFPYKLYRKVTSINIVAIVGRSACTFKNVILLFILALFYIIRRYNMHHSAAVWKSFWKNTASKKGLHK